MSDQYIKAAKAINEVALLLATDGYHTTTSFGRNHQSMEVTVFFHNYLRKNKIEHLLSDYAKENDKIEFIDLSLDGKGPLYTLTLKKFTS